MTQGVAPDAQILTMKVFGKGGGAYDSDYMVAIEDAVMLGCDAVNLSLGSGNAGFTTPMRSIRASWISWPRPIPSSPSLQAIPPAGRKTLLTARVPCIWTM